jgi:hypothetical protein
VGWRRDEGEGCLIERATESDYIHGVKSIYSIPDQECYVVVTIVEHSS